MVDFRPDQEQEQRIRDKGSVFEVPEVHPVSENRDHSNSVDAISANPVNRSCYVSASHDHTIKLWDANSHACLKTMEGHRDGIWACTYLQDGKRLITASVDGTSKIWDTNSGNATANLAFHSSTVYDAKVNDAMTQACTVGADKKICLWDLRNARQPIYVNEESTHSVTCCDFSNDQKAVMSATFGGHVNIIDLETMDRRVNYDIMVLSDVEEENMCYGIQSVKNHPQGGNIFILSSGIGIPNLICYESWWDEPLQRLETIGKYFGHSAGIRHCEFSPDNSQMLSCCMDHSMRIWNNEDCTQKQILTGHTDVVTSGCWLNERTVVTGSWDCKIMLWNL